MRSVWIGHLALATYAGLAVGMALGDGQICHRRQRRHVRVKGEVVALEHRLGDDRTDITSSLFIA